MAAANPRRCDYCPVRRRHHRGLSARGRSQVVLGGPRETLCEVRTGAAPRKDPAPGIRPLCGRRTEAERTGQAGELRLPGFHAPLREVKGGKVRTAAADVSQANAAETRGGENRTEAPTARPRPGGGEVAALGDPGASQLLWRSPELHRPQRLSPSGHLALATFSVSTEPHCLRDMGPHLPSRKMLAAS